MIPLGKTYGKTKACGSRGDNKGICYHLHEVLLKNKKHTRGLVWLFKALSLLTAFALRFKTNYGRSVDNAKVQESEFWNRLRRSLWREQTFGQQAMGEKFECVTWTTNTL